MLIVDFPDGNGIVKEGKVEISKDLFADNNNPRRKTIFLAGPTTRGGSFEDSWRKDSCIYLEEMGFEGVVHVPENIMSEFDEANLYEQSMWEWERLDNADVIVFWVPREFPKNPAMTTNIEYGRYVSIRPKACVYGRPEYANKMQYMDYMWQRFGDKDYPMAIHLSDVLKQALKKVGVDL